jgi:hypothetical protein
MSYQLIHVFVSVLDSFFVVVGLGEQQTILIPCVRQQLKFYVYMYTNCISQIQKIIFIYTYIGISEANPIKFHQLLVPTTRINNKAKVSQQ